MSRYGNDLADIIMDPRHWRGFGERTRTKAEATTDPVAKSMMLAIAAGYEVLAERIEERARQRSIMKRRPLR